MIACTSYVGAVALFVLVAAIAGFGGVLVGRLLEREQ